jgi:hypothetical protein
MFIRKPPGGSFPGGFFGNFGYTDCFEDIFRETGAS